jgi:hypothetical protein
LTGSGFGFFLEKIQIIPIDILLSQNAKNKLIDEFRDSGCVEGIKGPLSDSSMAHKIRVSQMSQVPRNLRLGCTKKSLEIADTEFALIEQIDDSQARFIGERIQDFQIIVHVLLSGSSPILRNSRKPH